MAKPDHTSVARNDAPAPTNPLSRPYWTRADAAPDQQDAATLAGLATAIHALARILTNNEAFRDIQANCQTPDPSSHPLDTPTTEGLFAVLYFLSEQAEHLSPLPVPALLHPSDVPCQAQTRPCQASSSRHARWNSILLINPLPNCREFEKTLVSRS